MSDTKQFHISTVLTITSGKFISVDHIGGVYDICNWMTGESLMTHQLPRVSREIEPVLEQQFPELAAINVPEGLDTWDKVAAFLEPLYATHGKFVQVAKMPEEDHTTIDPIAELKMMRPDAKVITIDGSGIREA